MGMNNTAVNVWISLNELETMNVPIYQVSFTHLRFTHIESREPVQWKSRLDDVTLLIEVC